MSFLSKIFNFINGKSGMGGEGDHSGAQFSPRPRLPAHMIEEILRTQPLVRRAVEVAPEDIVRAWRVYDTSDKVWQKIEDELDIEATMEKALIWADAFGGAILIPRYSKDEVTIERMALPFRQPKPGSLIGFKVYMPHQLRDWSNRTAQVNRQDNGLPLIYSIRSNKDNQEKPIHHSWTIPVFGAFKTCSSDNGYSSQTCEQLFGESKVDMIYDDMTRDIAGHHAVSHMLAKAVIDTLSIPGLAEKLDHCEDAEQLQVLMNAMNRAAAGIQGASAYQPMIIDANEELKRNTIAGAQGIAGMAEKLEKRFVAVTGVPWTRLMGEQAKGINNGGDADLQNYYDRVGTMRRRRLTVPLRAVDTLIAADRGVTTPGWEYGNLWQLDRKEEAEVDKKNAETDQIYFNMDLPFARSKIAKRLQKRYNYSDEELKDIAETDGADE